MSFDPIAVLEDKMAKKDVKKLKQAELLFSKGKYVLALPIFKQLMDKYPEDTYFKYKTGVCYLYKSDEAAKSVSLLENVEKEEPQFVDVKFYLGRAYHLMYRFDEAIDKFKEYKLKAKPIGEERVAVNLYLDYCENAIRLTKKEIDIKIHNPGSGINTVFSEYRPLITPDESMMLFTYRGKGCVGGRMDPITGKPDPLGEYFEDIMMSTNDGNGWSPPKPMPENVNTKDQDAAIALSIDGQEMFIYKSSKKVKEDIFVSSFDGEDWSHPRPIEGDVNTEFWEGSCCLAADGKTLYFSSDRPGGYGGRDIYKAELMDDGSWKNVQNLGQPVNSPYNEDAPFIHPDQITLYFSSDGPFSMGGYDVFYTKLKDGNWDVPENLGYPLNTTDDDRYYVVSADGEHGYMSSARSGGLGRHDIYAIEPNNIGGMPILALIVGEVTVDNTPAESRITLTDVATEKVVAVYKTNATNGKYTISVVPGNKYKLTIETEDAEPYVEYVDVKNLSDYVDVRHEFKIFSKEYREIVSVPDSVVTTLQQKIDRAVARKKLSLLVEIPADTTIKVEDNTHKQATDTIEVVAKTDSIVKDTTKISNEVESLDTLTAQLKDTASTVVEKTGVKEPANQEPLIFKNILFDFDKFFLRELSKQELEKLYRYLHNNPDVTVEIDGHTDWIGTEEYNMGLGERRAKSALNYIIERGIDKDRIVWRSYGEKEPVAPNALPSGKDNPDGRQLNRRCEFTIGGQTQSYNIKMKF